jgi:hypothetical protein
LTVSRGIAGVPLIAASAPRKNGGQHVMELAEPGCVDVPGIAVLRRNDSERE